MPFKQPKMALDGSTVLKGVAWSLQRFHIPVLVRLTPALSNLLIYEVVLDLEQIVIELPKRLFSILYM